MNDKPPIQLRNPAALERSNYILNSIQQTSTHGPYPLIDAALDAISTGDVAEHLFYLDAAAAFTITNRDTIRAAATAVRAAFGIPHDH